MYKGVVDPVSCDMALFIPITNQSLAAFAYCTSARELSDAVYLDED